MTIFHILIILLAASSAVCLIIVSMMHYVDYAQVDWPLIILGFLNAILAIVSPFFFFVQ